MSDFDWSDLDARLLQLLVAVVEAGSITGAAQALGVTQSAVSHQLDKLRAKMKPVIEKHSEKVGADTVKEVYDTLAKLRAAK